MSRVLEQKEQELEEKRQKVSDAVDIDSDENTVTDTERKFLDLNQDAMEEVRPRIDIVLEMLSVVSNFTISNQDVDDIKKDLEPLKDLLEEAIEKTAQQEKTLDEYDRLDKEIVAAENQSSNDNVSHSDNGKLPEPQNSGLGRDKVSQEAVDKLNKFFTSNDNPQMTSHVPEPAGSLLDDYADTSTEMPDHTSGDD